MPVETEQLDSISPDTLPTAGFGKTRTAFFEEDITKGVDWKTYSNEHTAILHLSGSIISLESEIEGRGGKIIGAKAGELWLIPAGHRYHSRAKGSAITYAVMNVPAEGNHLLPQMAKFDPFLLNCFRRIATAQSQPGFQSDLLVEQLQIVMETHLSMAYGHQAQLTARRVSDDVKFLRSEREKFLDYINDHIDTRLSIQDMSDVMDRTTHQLLDACYDSFGMSPARVVMEQRLRHVRELLETSQKTVTEIAVMTGFSSHSHLIRAFQQHYEMTPSQFRAEQLQFSIDND